VNIKVIKVILLNSDELFFFPFRIKVITFSKYSIYFQLNYIKMVKRSKFRLGTVLNSALFGVLLVVQLFLGCEK